MKFIDDVDAKKLRGGFYTPASVVNDCLSRVNALLGGTRDIIILEPAAGNGAFVRGIARLGANHRLRKAKWVCIELIEEEAAACRAVMSDNSLSGEVITDSFFSWMKNSLTPFNAVVGNPPFIRFQFVKEAKRSLAESLLRDRDHDLHGVANYWIPFALLSLDLLPPGGAFSLVLPSEFLSTVSAGQVRAELVRRFSSLRVDFYPRKTFPDILQDVLVVSGIREVGEATARMVQFSEHGPNGVRNWGHDIRAEPTNFGSRLGETRSLFRFDAATN
jgi:adenine-specific DNA-methyltransferase